MRKPRGRVEHDKRALEAALSKARGSLKVLVGCVAAKAPHGAMRAACSQVLMDVGALWEALTHLLE